MKVKIEQLKDLQKETIRRINKMKKEFSKEPIIKLFKNEMNYDQIIAQVGIPFTALCEHHKIAFFGEAHIAFIPNKWLTGLSKFGRIVEYYLNPVIETTQEKATHLIIKTLTETLDPKGVMVILKAKHNCICFRGIKKPSWTITSAINGSFKDNSSTKQEFLELIKLGNYE
mgnify:FL=1